MSAEVLTREPPSPQPTIEDDVRRVLVLKAGFYEALGIPSQGERADPLSFEPWLERAKYERLTDPDLIAKFRQEEDIQLTTNLRERYSTGQNTTTFILAGNKLRPEILPDEDFENILKRGLEYRRQTGSQELIREEREIDGFVKIQDIISADETAIGTRIVSLSPPGMIKDTSYPKQFIDIWEVKQNGQGEKYAQVTRFTTGLDGEGYRKSALKLTPDYFEDEGVEDLPFDAYYLSHPITLPPQEQVGSLEELYEAFFERDFRVIQERIFQELLQACAPFRSYFINQLCQENIDWVEFAKAFNAILVRSDQFLEERENSKQAVPVGTIAFYPQLSLREQVAFYGMQQVRTVAAGCGASVGFKIGGSSILGGLSPILSNSVGQYGLEKIQLGMCEVCRGSNSDNHYHCPNCPEKYADETNRPPEARTKQCSCGFKFGC